MKAEHLNPFIAASMNVIQTMSGVQVEPGKPDMKGDNLTFGDVTGVIGLAGKGVSGSLVISFEKDCIIDIVNSMLCAEFTELTEEVIQAVGELTNMICGGAKAALDEIGVTIGMESPTVICGKAVNIVPTSKEKMVSIPFVAPVGEFRVEASLETKKRRRRN